MIEYATNKQKDTYNKSEIEWHQELMIEYANEANKLLNIEPFDIKQYNYYIREMVKHTNKILELLK